MLFVNKTVDNEEVLQSFQSAAARTTAGSLSFVYLDVERFRSRMASLGLSGTKVPCMAFNTLEGNLYPYPEWRAFSVENIRRFASDYLSGRLKPKRKSSPVPPASKRWDYVVDVTRDTFDDVVMDSKKDVVLMLYRAEDEETEVFKPYYRKTAERFHKLGLDTVVVARIDLSGNQLPIDVEFERLPSILILPGKDKLPPYRYYHGKGKVRPIMFWVKEMVSFPFTFENDTPHLDEEQRVAYLEQTAERDARLERERKERDERLAKLKEEQEAEEQQ